jgi:hypothetical protein
MLQVDRAHSTDGSIDSKRDGVMPSKTKTEMNPNQPMVYQISIEGHLGREWADWFGALSITAQDLGETLLTVRVADQAALFGVLRKIRDIGMPLISVIRVAPACPRQKRPSITYSILLHKRRNKE